MTSNEALERWQASIGNDVEQRAPGRPAEPPPVARTGAPVASSASAAAQEWGKKAKTVLLVDSNLRSRESRARMMRTKGVHVDCAASADAARVRLGAEKYNLILVDLGRDTEIAESLVQEIRSKNSRQLVGFLVGSPLFIAKSLSGANPRPRRAPPLPVAALAEAPSEPAKAEIDFGQRIRDVEAGEKL